MIRCSAIVILLLFCYEFQEIGIVKLHIKIDIKALGGEDLLTYDLAVVSIVKLIKLDTGSALSAIYRYFYPLRGCVVVIVKVGQHKGSVDAVGGSHGIDLIGVDGLDRRAESADISEEGKGIVWLQRIESVGVKYAA